MLTLVLAESELELVPDALKAHPAVRSAAGRRAKRPARTLLDASVHHDALSDYPDGDRRGRPDIVHFTLLIALDSVLNKRDGLRVLVHTRNDELLRVSPETRLMRNYNRFVGLTEQLFRTRAVPSRRTPLMTLEDGWPLERVLREAVPVDARRTLLKEGGDTVTPAAWANARAGEGDACVILGAFPKGDFRSTVTEHVDEVVSFHAEPLSAWTVAMEVIAHWESATGAFADA